jgi:hypothetical protein
MCELVRGSRTETEGKGHLASEDLGVSVDIVDVDEDPGADFVAVKGRLVFSQATR